MGPDWKQFVEELIELFESSPSPLIGGRLFDGKQIAKIIKDREIQFLEKTLMKMDLEEGVPF